MLFGDIHLSKQNQKDTTLSLCLYNQGMSTMCISGASDFSEDSPMSPSLFISFKSFEEVKVANHGSAWGCQDFEIRH